MQATQSSTASGPGVYSGKFAALRHVTRQMSLNNAAMPVVRRSAAPVSGDAAALAGAGGVAGPRPPSFWSEPFQIYPCFRKGFPNKALAILWNFNGLQ